MRPSLRASIVQSREKAYNRIYVGSTDGKKIRIKRLVVALKAGLGEIPGFACEKWEFCGDFKVLCLKDVCE